MKEQFSISGMSCSSCSSHIQKAVQNLNGVKVAEVNLLSKNMNVEYNEKKVTAKDIIKTVEDMGYSISVITSYQEENNKSNDKIEVKSMKKRLIISAIFLLPLMYLSMYHMFFQWLQVPIPELMINVFHGEKNALTYILTQFALLLPIVIVNYKYFTRGFKSLFKGRPNMDSLIAIGSSASIIYGIFEIIMIGYGLSYGDYLLISKYVSDIYFESAGMILTLVTLGKYLEIKSKKKTTEAITKLINLAPKTALVFKEDVEIELKIEEIQINDIVIIKPGSSIPLDGIVNYGTTSVDESMITGESIPIEKKVGDTVISGTINKTGYIKFRVTKIGDDTTLSQIVKLVEQASNSKAPISKLADKISGIFVPIVIVIAIISAIIWFVITKDFEFSLSIAIAILVISCPCALGLATPVAIMVGTGKGAQNGILIKSAESLELLHSVNVIVFDKTGTLTVGKPTVTDIITLNNITENELLRIAAGLEKKSEHPLAEAIIKKAFQEKIDIKNVEDFQVISGRGINGVIKNEKYFSGNMSYIKENTVDMLNLEEIHDKYSKEGKTPLYFANEKEVIGAIVVEDVLKENSKIAIQKLKKMGLEIVMLTGDNSLVAKTIGEKIGVDKIIAQVLPQDKEKEIIKIKNSGKKVAMCGDGINDSPALVRADVGIAIGSGTDIAIESADVVLIKNNIEDVVNAIKLSKHVIRNIKMNLFWAFFYNTVSIPIAAGVLYSSFGIKLNPMFGSAAMALSSICVVLNALRLKNVKFK